MKDARIVLIVKLTCVTDSPSSDGSISWPIRFTPGWPGSKRMPNKNPLALRLGICMRN